jgi:ribose transport system permease protein
MGALNAFFTNVLNIMPFIATLGVATVLSGLGQVFTNMQDIPVNNKSFWALGTTKFFNLLPLPFLITIVLLVVYGVILKRTRFGRQVYRVNMGSPTAIVSYNLDAITVAVLGGISFTGGTGSMSGVFIGILLFNSFKNGLVISGLDSYYQIVASGLLLMAALILDFYREKSRLNALRSHKRVS